MGDNWDHVAYDPEHKLVLQVVCGKRTIENTDELIKKTKERLNGKMPSIIASDEYKPYKKSILKHYGKTVQPQRKGMIGRLPKPIKVAPEGLNYVVVHKTRENGKVINITPKIIFGTERSVSEVLGNSTVSRSINTAFIERFNGTDRHQNARKARATYEFSKDWEEHTLTTYFVNYSYNFCWSVRTLSYKNNEGKNIQRTPAMAAQLTDHVWKLAEWLSMPVVQR